ncbi:PE family protein [Mycobacterium sp.]|uniref:PE family protein n=1 Tax=Mycobacterium sp. TaxID=1785 RepID=UPI0031D0A4A7
MISSTSFVTARPEELSTTAAILDGIGSAVSSHNASAATPTTAIAPAAAEHVSALVAAQFSMHAQLYQTVSARAAAIHEMFVNMLRTSAGSYEATEAANVGACG